MINYLTSKKLFDESKTTASNFLNKYDYPWELIPYIGSYILEVGRSLEQTQYQKIGEDIWISKKAFVSPSAQIEGPAIIEEGVQIRHCAYIRGSVLVGRGSVVGNSTEIKNSILFSEVQTPHYNYIGDSILGYKSHMGAGAITSNIKSDKTTVFINIGSEKINTNLRKLGGIIADYCEIGCNCVINPGSVLGRNCSIYPMTMVRGYVQENHILKNTGEMVKKN